MKNVLFLQLLFSECGWCWKCDKVLESVQVLPTLIITWPIEQRIKPYFGNFQSWDNSGKWDNFPLTQIMIVLDQF